MARRTSRPKPPVTDYLHEEAKRKANPEVGLANGEKKRLPRQEYEYDPHRDPQLVWAGKASC